MTNHADNEVLIQEALPPALTLGMRLIAMHPEDVVMEAVKEGTVTATATPLHVGGTTIVIETDVSNGDRPVAKVIQTQSVLRPRP